MKIGTDICSVSRIERAHERFGDRFLRRIMTDKEIQYTKRAPRQTYQRIAGRFAAKEATVKALGTGWVGVDWKEVEISNLASGEPILLLHGRAEKRARALGLTQFEVSISHEREFAIAFVSGFRK